jgi:hypothetical protein
VARISVAGKHYQPRLEAAPELGTSHPLDYYAMAGRLRAGGMTSR